MYSIPRPCSIEGLAYLFPVWGLPAFSGWFGMRWSASWGIFERHALASVYDFLHAVCGTVLPVAWNLATYVYPCIVLVVFCFVWFSHSVWVLLGPVSHRWCIAVGTSLPDTGCCLYDRNTSTVSDTKPPIEPPKLGMCFKIRNKRMSKWNEWNTSRVSPSRIITITLHPRLYFCY